MRKIVGKGYIVRRFLYVSLSICLIKTLFVVTVSEIPLSEIEKRLESRRQHLKETCHRLGLDEQGNDTLHKPNPWEFLINLEHRLVWCNVFKAASTSWMYNFNLLAGYDPAFLNKSQNVPINLARKKYPRPTLDELQEAFKNSTSFIIVRHPLERLLSAYKNKFEFAPRRSFYRNMAQKIISKYRRIEASKLRRTAVLTPSFSEFVQYLLDSAKNGEHLDEHWIPIAQFCTPCMFDFKIIAHTETLEEDQDHLIKLAGLEHVLRKEWRNHGKSSTSSEVFKYYSQLKNSQILQLCELYKYDFQLFNYTTEAYLDLGIKDN